MTKLQWQDVTSYQRGEVRIPRAWEVRVRALRICVHRHRDYAPSTWLLSVYGAVQIGPFPLLAEDLGKAQAEALKQLRRTLRGFLRDIS